MSKSNQPSTIPDLGSEQHEVELDQQIPEPTPMTLPVLSYQARLDNVHSILNDALAMAQPRTTLPHKLNQFSPFKYFKLQQILLRGFNFLFKQERTIDFGLIQAIRESLNLNQQLLERLSSLEKSAENAEQRLILCERSLEERLILCERSLEERLILCERSLEERLSVTERTLNFIEKNYGERLQYLQADVIYQKRLASLKLDREQPTILNTDLNTDLNLDAFYLAFEDRFRGSRSLIRSRLQEYIPVLQDLGLNQSGNQILDIGCGRGEWIELLRDEGYDSIGLDLNLSMVQYCQEMKLFAIQSDALAYLQSLPDSSLSAVTGFHIVEHLPFELLLKVIAEAYRVVRKGGIVIFETPNPHNITVGSCSFYTDPTHINPIPSHTLQFLIQYSGFSKTELLLFNPSDIEIALIRKKSELDDRFNQLFYTSMDYAVLGIKE